MGAVFSVSAELDIHPRQVDVSYRLVKVLFLFRVLRLSFRDHLHHIIMLEGLSVGKSPLHQRSLMPSMAVWHIFSKTCNCLR